MDNHERIAKMRTLLLEAQQVLGGFADDWSEIDAENAEQMAHVGRHIVFYYSYIQERLDNVRAALRVMQSEEALKKALKNPNQDIGMAAFELVRKIDNQLEQ